MGDFDEMANAHAQTRVKPPRETSPIRAVAAYGAVAAAVIIGLTIAEPTMALSVRLIAGAGAGLAAALLINRLGITGGQANRAAPAERQREHRAAEAEKQIAEMKRKATRDGEGTEEC